MPEINRRRLLQGFGAAAIGFFPAARVLNARGSGIGWCRADPVFSLDGNVGHIYLAAAAEDWVQNTSRLDMVIVHPRRCTPNLIATDNGFGQGMLVNFAESAQLRKRRKGYEIEIQTYVPTSGAMPVMVEFAPGDGSIVTASAVGVGNSWITFGAFLPSGSDDSDDGDSDDDSD